MSDWWCAAVERFGDRDGGMTRIQVQGDYPGVGNFKAYQESSIKKQQERNGL
jgi:hypothetical protein